MKINHIEKPMGYLYKTITASYIVDCEKGKYQEAAQILVSDSKEFHNILFDSGRSREVLGVGTRIDFPLEPRRRYYWKVKVWNDLGECEESDSSWFETGLMEQGFQGSCISPDLDETVQPVFVKEFFLEEKIDQARLYLTCLGVYEAFLNGKRIGDEILAPGITVYNHYVQYQTYDVTSLLVVGTNRLEISAGNGWYKGLYGYRQNDNYRKGKSFELLADLYVNDELKICSDLTWKIKKNRIMFSDMYDGEIQDTTLKDTEEYPVKLGKLDKTVVKDRLGLPIRVKERIQPVAVLQTPNGETVLDMGQNMVGWVAFTCREKAGSKVSLEHGEVLQNGCFYNGNYRTAKARFDYISNGIEEEVRPRLCFFGFRYVRLTGFTEVHLADFKGEVVYTDLERTGYMRTGNSRINQLISNILWSQKGNFLDIPTDCPQRDEKMGWTGDAQMFAGTAALNMDCYGFFRKYLNDISLEQIDTGGLVPQIVPSVGRNERTSAAWGDAALIIPWTLYRYYGDASILEEQYESMKAWITYIDKQNEEHKTNPDLWQNGFHYGDWLALDGGYYHMPTGGTDVYYISSAYFYYSTVILKETAQILGKQEDFRIYQEKADRIRNAIIKEFFTGNGKLSIDTQSAYIVAVVFGIVKEQEQLETIKDQFLLRFRKDGYRLKTGFVGTPFIMKMLSVCNRSDLAFQLLLNEEYPGWLYPVKLGATTMWERWDALNPDGSMSDSGMNSLNHYVNGSVQEWMYCHMAGIEPVNEQNGGAGFKQVLIHPHIHPEIKWMDTNLQTSAGRYSIYWEIDEEEKLLLRCQIPFDAKAQIVLPSPVGEVIINGEKCDYQPGDAICADAGRWQFEYQLSKDYRPYYSLEDSVKELVKNPQVREYLYEKAPMLVYTDKADIQNMTLKEMSKLPFFLGIGTRLGLDQAVLEEMEQYISRIPK